MGVTVRLGLFIYVIPVWILVGCSGKGGEVVEVSPSKEKVLSEFVFPVYNDVITLDPAKTQDDQTINVLQNMYEGLVAYNEKNELKPCLAERWEVSNGGRTYTFHLKKGVKFHNGKELNAEDVKYSFERACSPLLKSPVAKIFFSDIAGVGNRLEGRANQISGIRVVDPYTVEVTLTQPRSYFISKLANIVASIVPKGGVPEAEICRIEGSIGTGPYRLMEYKREQQVKLGAHHNYHGHRVAVEQIRMPVVGSILAAIHNYKVGKADYCMVPPRIVKTISADPVLRDQLHSAETAYIAYLEFNSSNKPFDCKKVRQALAMAIDRTKIAAGPLEGCVALSHRFLPRGILGYRADVKCIEFNVPKARKLLAEAGYPNGKGLRMPVIYVDGKGYTSSRRVIENVAMQLKNNLNIIVSIRSIEWKELLSRLNAKQLSLRWAGWMPDYLDPASAISDLFTTHAARNRCNYSNPEVDKLCMQADAHPDPNVRSKLYAQAENIILSDAVVIPLYTKQTYYLKKKNIEGLQHNLLGVMPYTSLVVR